MESFALFVITATVVLSFVYFAFLDRLQKIRSEQDRGLIRDVYLLRKMGGFVILGLSPGLVAWGVFGMIPQQAGLLFGKSLSLWPQILAATALFITLNVFNSRNAAIRAMYPEMRLSGWSAGDFGTAAGGWLIYLAGYEFLFRGLLLFGCYEAFGLWPAVVINLALYAALHLPKGLKEATAAIPFGALLCYLTLESGSIWPAVWVHAVQAISCEWFCVVRNPGMKFNLSKS